MGTGRVLFCQTSTPIRGLFTRKTVTTLNIPDNRPSFLTPNLRASVTKCDCMRRMGTRSLKDRPLAAVDRWVSSLRRGPIKETFDIRAKRGDERSPKSGICGHMHLGSGGQQSAQSRHGLRRCKSRSSRKAGRGEVIRWADHKGQLWAIQPNRFLNLRVAANNPNTAKPIIQRISHRNS